MRPWENQRWLELNRFAVLEPDPVVFPERSRPAEAAINARIAELGSSEIASGEFAALNEALDVLRILAKHHLVKRNC